MKMFPPVQGSDHGVGEGELDAVHLLPTISSLETWLLQVMLECLHPEISLASESLPTDLDAIKL